MRKIKNLGTFLEEMAVMAGCGSLHMLLLKNTVFCSCLYDNSGGRKLSLQKKAGLVCSMTQRLQWRFTNRSASTDTSQSWTFSI